MKVLTPGHCYSLANFENKEEAQTLQFIYKLPEDKVQADGDPTKLVTVADGTTNEEVLEVLIDRLKYLYDKFPSNETHSAILYLQAALASLLERTANRVLRGVEGQAKL